jgi:hypothetical protein
MLKILRIISTPNGHLIHVSMKGFGMSSVMKLAAFAVGQELRELDVCEGLTAEDWHSELRRSVLTCGDAARPLTLFVDQYKMLRDEMYGDLEVLLKNQVPSEIVAKPDIVPVLASIY